MANIGLRSFLWAPCGADEGTYTREPSVLAGAIEAKVSLSANDTKLYADDIKKFEDNSVSDGTISLTIDNDDESIFAELLGKTKIEKTVTLNGEEVTVSEYISSNQDVAIPVGFGYITGKQTDGGRLYRVNFFKKVSFKPFETDSKTKADKLEFTTPAIEGTIYMLNDGTYKIESVFENSETAIEYLKSLFTQQAEG